MRKTCWGWGKEQHLNNTCLPTPSFLLSEHSLQGSLPTQAVAGCVAGHESAALQICCTGKVLELGAGNTTSCHPPSPLLFQWFQEIQ